MVVLQGQQTTIWKKGKDERKEEEEWIWSCMYKQTHDRCKIPQIRFIRVKLDFNV